MKDFKQQLGWSNNQLFRLAASSLRIAKIADLRSGNASDKEIDILPQ